MLCIIFPVFPSSFADKVSSLYPSELGPTSLLRTGGFTVKTASCCNASKAVLVNLQWLARLVVPIAQATTLMKMMNVLNWAMATVALISIKRHDVPSFARQYEVIWFSINDYIMLFTFQARAHDVQRCNILCIVLTKFYPDRSSNDGWPLLIIISTMFLLLKNLFSLHLPRAMCEFVIPNYNRSDRTHWCRLKCILRALC